METGIIEIKMIDGSEWNVFFANRTQKGNMILWYNAHKEKVISFEFIVKGIHTTKQFITHII
jgi:hypothetical protein